MPLDNFSVIPYPMEIKMSKFFEISSETFRRRSSSMSNETFQSIRRLQESGAPLPLIVSNPAWQALLDRIDSNITERSIVLQDAISKLPMTKRALVEDSIDDLKSSSNKRQRVDGATEDAEAHEEYRKQSWMQYYDWLDQQKTGGSNQVSQAGAEKMGDESDRDEDDDIHNALLGLS